MSIINFNLSPPINNGIAPQAAPSDRTSNFFSWGWKGVKAICLGGLAGLGLVFASDSLGTMKKVMTLFLLLQQGLISQNLFRANLVSNLEFTKGGRIKTELPDGTIIDTTLPSSLNFQGNGCLKISDYQWSTITKDEIDAFKVILTQSSGCMAPRNRLIQSASLETQEVARMMGFNEVNELSVSQARRNAFGVESIPGAEIYVNNHVTLAQNLVFSLNGWEGSDSRKEARGVLAHEISRRICKHHERLIARAFEILGLSVESFEDMFPFFEALYSGFKGLPNPESSASANRLMENFMEVVVRNRMKGKYDQAISETLLEEAQNQAYSELSLQFEEEADRLIVKIPEFARGQINYFSNQIAACEKDFSSNCEVYYTDSSSHPSHIKRIQYLTQALCEKAPEENSDLCLCPVHSQKHTNESFTANQN